MKYTNNKCPVCGLVIADKDDIVVCPECGTPHHRDCYNSVGHCVNEDKHTAGYEYKPVEEKPVGTVCTRCGEINDTDAVNCKTCGYPLDSDLHTDAEYSTQQDQKQGSFRGFDYKSIRIQIPPVPGVNPGEDIGGEKASDLITCVGTNANYYVPKFKKMLRVKSKVSWNWGAFFFSDIWFFFRKCYFQGIANLIINLSCISVFEWVSYLAYQKTGAINNAEDYNRILSNPDMVSALLPLSMIMIAVMVVMLVNRVIWAVFANHIYRQTVYEKIKKLKAAAKEKGATVQEQIVMIAASGGVNIIIPILYFMFYPAVFQIIIPMLWM